MTEIACDAHLTFILIFHVVYINYALCSQLSGLHSMWYALALRARNDDWNATELKIPTKLIQLDWFGRAKPFAGLDCVPNRWLGQSKKKTQCSSDKKLTQMKARHEWDFFSSVNLEKNSILERKKKEVKFRQRRRTMRFSVGNVICDVWIYCRSSVHACVRLFGTWIASLFDCFQM